MLNQQFESLWTATLPEIEKAARQAKITITGVELERVITMTKALLSTYFALGYAVGTEAAVQGLQSFGNRMVQAANGEASTVGHQAQQQLADLARLTEILKHHGG